MQQSVPLLFAQTQHYWQEIAIMKALIVGTDCILAVCGVLAASKVTRIHMLHRATQRLVKSVNLTSEASAPEFCATHSGVTKS